MPDAHKPFRHYLQRKTPNKFRCFKKRCLHLFGFAVVIGEDDFLLFTYAPISYSTQTGRWSEIWCFFQSL